MLNAFYLQVCRQLEYAEVGFDIREALMRPVDLPLHSASRSSAGRSRDERA